MGAQENRGHERQERKGQGVGVLKVGIWEK